MISYELYLKEKKDFNDNYPLLSDREKEELLRKYNNGLRRYLSLAIDTIKNNLGVDYSLYKKDKVMSASNYKVMETLVQKSVEEVKTEIDNLKNIENSKQLSEAIIEEVNLALEIIETYANVKI